MIDSTQSKHHSTFPSPNRFGSNFNRPTHTHSLSSEPRHSATPPPLQTTTTTTTNFTFVSAWYLYILSLSAVLIQKHKYT